jgi:hypothetical protein
MEVSYTRPIPLGLRMLGLNPGPEFEDMVCKLKKCDFLDEKFGFLGPKR